MAQHASYPRWLVADLIQGRVELNVLAFQQATAISLLVLAALCRRVCCLHMLCLVVAHMMSTIGGVGCITLPLLGVTISRGSSSSSCVGRLCSTLAKRCCGGLGDVELVLVALHRLLLPPRLLLARCSVCIRQRAELDARTLGLSVRIWSLWLVLLQLQLPHQLRRQPCELDSVSLHRFAVVVAILPLDDDLSG